MFARLAAINGRVMHIVLLNIDGLQPAYLGAYGCEWIDTPTSDRWAAAGVVFDQHFADTLRDETAHSNADRAREPHARRPRLCEKRPNRTGLWSKSTSTHYNRRGN